jgi:rod shape-determining protein MreD
MTRGILLVTTIYLAAVADSVVAPLLVVGGVRPDFLALAAMLLTFLVRGDVGILIAAGVGGVADVSSPGRCGVAMAAFGLVAFVLFVARSRTWRRPLARAVVTFPAVAAISLFITILRGLLNELDWSPGDYIVAGLGAGLYTALLGFPIYYLLDRFARRQAGGF